jgi:hypothetical protein
MMKAAILCQEIDCSDLYDAWDWLIPSDHRPVMIGHFGETVFEAPDGSSWLLSVLEGEYEFLARDAEEFNILNKNPENVEHWFLWDWASIAFQNGIVPGEGECLGWKLPAILGGPFAVDQIGVFPRRAYLTMQGQLLRQVKERGSATRS